MKKRYVVLLVLLVVILGGAVYGATKAASFYKEYNNQVSKEGEEVTIVIEKGSSAKKIASVLKEKGLIRYERAFVMRASESEYGSKLKYGTFTLHKGMCIEDMLKTIAQGGEDEQTEIIKLVVPEGYSIEMIAARAEKEGLCSAEEFLEAADTLNYDYDFLEGIEIPKGVNYDLQGFLFPATYEFKKGTTAEEIVDRMLKAFEDRVTAEELQKVQESGRSLYEIITIASIIEREAKLDEERPTIAGVIYNRLEMDMKLQMCPTVLYPLTEGKYNVNQVLYRDLEIDSPYNTYKNKGLPVGAICNPGLPSIKAALNPEKHEYLFYHTDDETKGNHIFSKTYQEHEDSRIKK